jgi:hypothetical protein
MPDMPGLVARPRFMRLHDEYLNESTENRRRFGLGLLSGDPLAGIYRQLGIGNAPDWRHLEREFYAEEGLLAYWPYNRFGYLGNKQEILRQGTLEAIRVADGLPASKMTRQYFNKPVTPGPVDRRLETWWMCSGNRFEVNVLDGDVQVTMMILTPAMPPLPDSRKVKLEQDGDIWTVGHKDVLSRYLSEYRADQTRYPTLEQPYKTNRTSKSSNISDTSQGAKERKDLRRINKFRE